jgi:energy-coupling factor transporter ATP-binding protein EcfA2
LVLGHDIDFCADHLKRVVVMSGGRILADGPAEQILAQVPTLVQAQAKPPQLRAIWYKALAWARRRSPQKVFCRLGKHERRKRAHVDEVAPEF